MSSHQSRKNILCGQVLSLTPIVTEKPAINFVCIMRDTVSKGSRIEIAAFVVLISRRSMDLFTFLQVFRVGESLYFRMLVLHAEHFPGPSLTIGHTPHELINIS